MKPCENFLFSKYGRFYYDFFVPEQQLSPEDLKKVKKEMDRIIRANYPIRREEVSVEEARYSQFVVLFSLLVSFIEVLIFYVERGLI
jgi:hypothetical protein